MFCSVSRHRSRQLWSLLCCPLLSFHPRPALVRVAVREAGRYFLEACGGESEVISLSLSGLRLTLASAEMEAAVSSPAEPGPLPAGSAALLRPAVLPQPQRAVER